ncbi:VPLPA-CTERM sorting domain-containing protein [Pseudotabrizicola formosa]|uniref:VPLPA-CTERM sorting domain-containing protein n=1 Tax=Pseudotabrizicola formosa TaxID=2030009 RepID=UPI00143D9D61|nr:VPLPA-CTERM sorting domain-containing protein [Pseudotabrizicola formosa]
MLDFIRTTALGVVAALAIGATSAGAVTFTGETNGGSGTFVDNGPNAFYDFQLTLTSNDNGTPNIFTTGSAVADQAYKVSGVWTFQSPDPGGSSFDPFGYFIDSVFVGLVQLSTNGLIVPAIHNGTFEFIVAAGQTFGFYALATDGILGSSTSVAYGNVSQVPVPAAGLLLLSALGGVALVRRRSNKAAAV